MARPMPRPAPVTSATVPVRSRSALTRPPGTVRLPATRRASRGPRPAPPSPAARCAARGRSSTLPGPTSRNESYPASHRAVTACVKRTGATSCRDSSSTNSSRSKRRLQTEKNAGSGVAHSVASSSARSGAWALAMSGEWKAPLTASGHDALGAGRRGGLRRAPPGRPCVPLTTTWPGLLKLAGQTPSTPAHSSSTTSSSRPEDGSHAARVGLGRAPASPRRAGARGAGRRRSDTAPVATSAEYSPRLWPMATVEAQAVAAQDAEDADGVGQQRRLRDVGARQQLRGALAHMPSRS